MDRAEVYDIPLDVYVFLIFLYRVYTPWRNKLNRAAQGGEYDLLLWWESVVYITSRKRRTVRLGSLLELFESFPIKK